MTIHKTFYTVLILTPIKGGSSYQARISDIFTNKEEALRYMNSYQNWNSADPTFTGNYICELIERELPVYS